jgi:hypothetical protein
VVEGVDEKRMKLRYDGACRACGASLPARAEAIYERSTKTVRCLTCSPATSHQPVVEEGAPRPSRNHPTLDVGVPGASARREYERRQAKRVQQIREKHPRTARLRLAMSDDPQSTKAWDAGALGEERLGEALNELSPDTIRVLHDRRIPDTRANIDHLAITPSRIYVIDAKRYRGKRPTRNVEGGILRPRIEKLIVGSRDQTKLVDGVLRQVEVIRSIIDDDVPVTGVLCFIDANWPLLGGSFTTRGVDVLWPKRLYGRLSVTGTFHCRVLDVEHQLAAAPPSA